MKTNVVSFLNEQYSWKRHVWSRPEVFSKNRLKEVEEGARKKGASRGWGVAERGRAGERRGCWTSSCVSGPTTTPRALIHSEQSHSHQTAPPPTPSWRLVRWEVLETASRRLCALREECVPPKSSSCLRLRFVLFGLLTYSSLPLSSSFGSQHASHHAPPRHRHLPARRRLGPPPPRRQARGTGGAEGRRERR